VPTAILAGAFGQRNPGDEAILDAFAGALPDWDLIATAAVPPHGRAPEVVPSDDPPRVARAVARADAVVFAGGTVFKELSARTRRPPLDLLHRAAALAYGAKALGKRLAMVGVGAAPIRPGHGQRLARGLIRQADLLVLRDEESADVLAELGAPTPFRIGADAAWTLVEHQPQAREPSDRVIVALSCAAGDGELVDDLAAALVPLLAQGLTVSLQPWQIGGPVRPDDLDMARAVAARLGGTADILLPPANLDDAIDVFVGARLVLGLRFHALIAAAAAGCPFVAYTHEPKLAGAARRFAQPAVSPADGGDALAAVLFGAANRPVAPTPSAVRGEIARAAESMRLLRLVLSDGESGEPESIGTLPLVPAEWSP
jgi:polysaccharide pyruvyl transferase WcaK-like protein